MRNEQLKLIYYPIVIGILFLLLGSGMLIFVIPMYKGFYHRLGPELCWLTGLLVKLSDSVLNKPLLWSISLLLTGSAIVLLFRNYGWEKIRSWILGFGGLDSLSRDAALFPFHGIASEILGFYE